MIGGWEYPRPLRNYMLVDYEPANDDPTPPVNTVPANVIDHIPKARQGKYIDWAEAIVFTLWAIGLAVVLVSIIYSIRNFHQD